MLAAYSVLTLKDLSSDPINATVNHVWVWTHGGAYFGVPVHNFIGWWAAFLVITVIAVMLSWHRRGYSKKLLLNRGVLVVPIVVITSAFVLAFTRAWMITGPDQNIGQVSALVAALAFIPFLWWHS